MVRVISTYRGTAVCDNETPLVFDDGCGDRVLLIALIFPLYC
jgi:hypothetical protein